MNIKYDLNYVIESVRGRLSDSEKSKDQWENGAMSNVTGAASEVFYQQGKIDALNTVLMLLENLKSLED